MSRKSTAVTTVILAAATLLPLGAAGASAAEPYPSKNNPIPGNPKCLQVKQAPSRHAFNDSLRALNGCRRPIDVCLDSDRGARDTGFATAQSRYIEPNHAADFVAAAPYNGHQYAYECGASDFLKVF